MASSSTTQGLNFVPASEIAPKGKIKGLPYPEGLFNQLALLGHELLADAEAWKVVHDREGITQFRRPCTTLDLPAVLKGESAGSSMSGGAALVPNPRSIKHKHDYVAARGSFPFGLKDCVRVIVHEMPQHVGKWDKTFIEVEVVEKWSEEDVCYAYRIDPGPMIGKRDMIYYEGWRTDPTTGVVVNVSASMPALEASVPLPKSWVRAVIGFHYKRFTPMPGSNETTLYETIQQMDLGGWIPQALVTNGAMDGLRTEIVGFSAILRDVLQQGQ